MSHTQSHPDGRIRLILFDVDGTLVSGSDPYHVASYSHAIKSVFGLESSLYDIVPYGMVDSRIFLEILAVRGMPEALARPHLPELFSARYAYLVQNLPDSLAGDVLPGVVHALETLRQRFILGVLTGNEERSAWHRLAKAGLRQYFSTGAFGNESERRADLVGIAAERAGKLAGRRLSVDEVLLVGDTPIDILCAQDAHVRIVAVATGRYGMPELEGAGADLVLPDLTHLPELQRFAGGPAPQTT